MMMKKIGLEEQDKYVNETNRINNLLVNHKTGPHLHFELWSEGFSIDPNTLIDFE